MVEQKGYELGYLISPALPEDGVLKVLEEMRSLIEAKGGMIENTQNPKQIRLAYPIKKATNAYFGTIQFLINPRSLSEIRTGVNTNSQVLRHLVIEWNKRLAARSIAQPPLRRPKEATPISPFVAEPVKKDMEAPRVDEAEIDKKLDEILGE